MKKHDILRMKEYSKNIEKYDIVEKFTMDGISLYPFIEAHIIGNSELADIKGFPKFSHGDFPNPSVDTRLFNFDKYKIKIRRFCKRLIGRGD